MQFVHARREACQYANHGYLDAVIEAINPCEDRPDDRQHGSHWSQGDFLFLSVDSFSEKALETTLLERGRSERAGGDGDSR